MTTKQETDMSGVTVVEFENAVHSEETYLSSELQDGPPYTVHGVALGAGDVTKGQSGIEKKWPAEELQKAADSLQGTNLVVDHENSAHGVIGRVTKSGYKEPTGVVYEAELYDEDLAEKIQKGLLEVSIRGSHAHVDTLDEDPDSGTLLVEDISFSNLSVVPSGASPSNTLEMGAHSELSAAELSSFTDTLESEELQEIEPGMWVKWGENRGVTISQVQDGEIEVDIYEEQDGQWRSIEETEMVPVDDLEEWDVDEDNIGPAQDEDEEDEDEEESEEEAEEDMPEDEEPDSDEEDSPDPPEFSEGDMVQWQVNPSMKGKIVHAPESQDIVMVEVMEEEDGEMVSSGFTVTAGYSDLEKVDESRSEEENAAVDRGEFVKWRDVDNDWQYGQIIEIAQDGSQMVATLRRFTESGDKLDETDEKPVQGLDKWDESPVDETDSDTTETESEEDTKSDDSSGATVNDLIQVLSTVAEASATSKNVPSEDAEPQHRPMGQMADLFNKFIEEEGSAESTLAEFMEWLNQSEELADRVEGEDEILDSSEAIRRMKENDPAYINEELEMEEELQDYEMHEVTYDGTTESDWSKPAMEDFDTDDLSEIAQHFIISATGFPPENYGDLKLPIVEPSGELNLNALAAVKGGRGVSAVEGLSSSMEDEIVEYVNGLANRKFDKNWGNEEEENSETMGEATNPTKTVAGVRVLPGDDLQQARSGESAADSLTQYKVTTMNEEIEEKLGELDNPVAVESGELEELQEKADRFEEMSENLESLRERTEILDEVERDSVEELRDGDEPVVVESARYEELQSEAEQVKGVYAAQLSEHYDAFDADELTDKFSIEELREKFEDEFGSVEEELASSEDAEPRSQDPSEEELEEESTEEESEEELSDEVAAKQDEIRDKILGGN